MCILMVSALLTFLITESAIVFGDPLEADRLKIITFNVQFLPGFAAVKNDRGMGGVLIASRLPILESHHFHFRDYSDPAKRRPDDFVAKGVVHARVARSAENQRDFVDVFVTHLVAGDNVTRPPQYAELAMFVRKHGDRRQPAVIMGDMNTDGKPSERAEQGSRYNLLTSLLQDARVKSLSKHSAVEAVLEWKKQPERRDRPVRYAQSAPDTSRV